MNNNFSQDLVFFYFEKTFNTTFTWHNLLLRNLRSKDYVANLLVYKNDHD